MQIAKKGIGTTRPNPSVGTVVVYENKIIGEGFTSPYGGNHAEVNAINSVKDKTILKEATVYVTLEPCAHHGKTPPCADLLIKHQVKNVIIGCVDTNSLVAGKGIERLKKAGINVIIGVLEAECLEHHKRFFTVQNKKRPYIILKWAQTQDGFIAPASKDKQKPVWISNRYSQQLVHKWRSEEHAILVGTNTVIADNPKLNVRSWSGENPIRIVLDRKGRIPKNVNVFDGSVKTLLLTEKEEGNEIAIETAEFVVEKLILQLSVNEKNNNNLTEKICNILFKYKIQSVIIEGGTQTLQTFIDANLWDEARVFTGAISFGSGVEAPQFSAKFSSEEKIVSDTLKIYRND